MGFEDPRKNRPTIAASSPPPSPGKTGIIHVRLHNVRASSFQNWKISSSILVEFEKLNRNPAPNNITCRSYRSGKNLVCKKKRKESFPSIGMENNRETISLPPPSQNTRRPINPSQASTISRHPELITQLNHLSFNAGPA